MTQIHEGIINSEFYSKMRLNWISLLLPSTQYQTEDISIFWRDLARTHYAGASADLLAKTEVPSVASEMNARTSLSGGPSRISRVPKQEVCHRG